MDEIDQKLDELVAVKETREDAIDRNSSPKIQKVPAFLRENPDFAKYCSPTMISFGPIHHGSENLNIGRDFKNLWTSLYIEEYRQETHKNTNKEASRFLHDIIQKDFGKLKELFSDNVLEGYDDKQLTWMLFVDGCSLLYYMDKVDVQCPEALQLKPDQLMFTWRDILLLENQLPMRVLELLSKRKGADLGFLVMNFQTRGLLKRVGEAVIPIRHKPPTHTILDSHRYLVSNMENGKDEDQYGDDETADFWQRYKNVRDLKKAGIRVKPNKTDRESQNISFISGWFGGELRLPKFPFDNTTTYLIRNMIAYEMCPDFPNNFAWCVYFSFLDSLIDDAEDVKQLRLAGVLQNLLGSDEDVAKLINEIGQDLPTNWFNYFGSHGVAYSRKYNQVKLQIHKHYRQKWKIWLADLRNTYFNSPWSFIAFLAALLVLILTLIQTIYTLHPKN